MIRTFVPPGICEGRGGHVRALLWQVQEGRCFHCLLEMSPDRDGPHAVTFEHIVPQERGGKWARNVVLAHQSCNERRSNKPLPRKKARAASRILRQLAELASGLDYHWPGWTNPDAVGAAPGMADSKQSDVEATRLASGLIRGAR